MIVGSAEVRITSDATGLGPSIEEDFAAQRKVFSTEGAAAGAEFGEGFARGADGRLRDARGKFVAEGAAAGADFGESFTRDAQGRLRDARGKFVSELGLPGEADGEGEAAGGRFTDAFRRRLGGGKGLLGGIFDRDRSSASALTSVVGQLSVSAASAGAFLATWGPLIAIAGAAAAALLPALTIAVPAVAGIAAVAGVVALSADQLISAVQPLVDGVASLKDAVGGALTAGFADQFRDLAEGIIPVLRVGLVDLAEAINGGVQPMLAFLSSSEGLSLVGQALGGLSAAAEPLFGLLRPLTAIFLNLTVAAAPGLLELSSALFGVVERFSDWIAAGTQSGALAEGITFAVRLMIDTFGALSAAFGPLLQLLALFGPTLLGGINAALVALGGGITSLIGASQAMAGALSGADGLLQPLIAGARAFAAAVAPALGPAFDAIGAFVADVVPVVIGVLGPAIGGLGVAIAAVLPIFTALLPLVSQAVTGLAAGLQVALDGITGVGGILDPVVAGVQAFVAAVGPQLQPTFEAIGQVINALLPTLLDFGRQIGEIVGPALGEIGRIIGEELLPAFQQVLPIITPVANFILQVIGGAVVGALKGAINVIEGVLKIITGVFQVFVGVFTGDWGKAWDGIKNIFSGAWQAILGAVEFFLNVGILKGFKVGLDLLQGIFKGGLDLVKTGWKSALDFLKDAAETTLKATLDFFVKLPGRILDALSGLGRLLLGKGSDLISGLKTGAEELLPKLLDFAKGIPGKVLGLYVNAGKLLLGVGRDIIQGLLDGAGQLLPSIGSFFLSKLPGWIVGPFKQALGIASPSKVFAAFGRNISEGLIQGIEDDTPQAERAVERFAKRLAARYETASERFKAIVQERRQLLTSVRDEAVAGAGVFDGDSLDFTTLKQRYGDQVIAITRFNADLAKLKRAGISDNVYRQLVDLGVEQGTRAAEAILQGGAVGVGEINQFDKLLGKKAGGLGRTAADELYGAGVDAARGLLEGLQSQRQSLIDVAKDMGKEVAKAVREELKIKSPSRVMADLGAEVPAGLALGIDRQRDLVTAAATRMAGAAVVSPDLAQLQALAQAQAGATLTIAAQARPVAAVGRTNNYTIDARGMTAAELARELEDRDALDAALNPVGV